MMPLDYIINLDFKCIKKTLKCYGCVDIHFDLGDYMYKIKINKKCDLEELKKVLIKQFVSEEEAKKELIKVINHLEIIMGKNKFDIFSKQYKFEIIKM